MRTTDQTRASITTHKRIEVGLLYKQNHLLEQWIPLPPMSPEWMFNRMKPKRMLGAIGNNPEIGAGAPFFQV